MIDLVSMTIPEIEQLIVDGEKMIKQKRKEAKSELMAEWIESAKIRGLTVEEVMGKTEKKKHSPPPVKYINPENKSETWTGKGRKPKWVLQILEQGRNIEEFSLEAQPA